MIRIKDLRPLLEVIALGLMSFGLHKGFFYIFGKTDAGFNYCLCKLYGFFLLCAFIIVLALIIIKKRNIDHVGYTFLLLTCVKMGAAYMMLQPILKASDHGLNFEKANFFIVFSVFLAIETLTTIRLLNKTQ